MKLSILSPMQRDLNGRPKGQGKPAWKQPCKEVVPADNATCEAMGH